MVDSSRNDLWNKGFHFGDWLFYSISDDLDGKSAVTDKYLIAQCFFAHSTQILIDAAKVLGRQEDISRYENLLQRVKKAFRNEYVTGSGRLISSTQTAYVLALHFDMLEPHHRAYAAERLVENVISYNYHITTGFLGTPYICHVLSRFGYADIAYKLLFQESYPSWLYPVKMGATTIWERWDGIKPDSTFQNAGMNSFNHYAYGAVGDWMYRVVCGIEIEQPGYKQSSIVPVIAAELNHAKSSTVTPYGTILSGWQKENGLKYELEIPANTQTTFKIPAISKNQISVDQMELNDTNSWIQDGMLYLKLGSGRYMIQKKKD
jgi:alpha-L-rhamnosidase